ncbi:hypothetical protein Dsin_015327 [Dipteronia sinensis]|uniref:Histidine-containing phosphotransfer protein n=1 Tax=Dipteronia sinensis TaxID=43782 RepID=A0AAE0E4G2_9ROSI|nr:hypothetical protein Dsin_015327 [Dipteronia sinensis]
MEGLKQQISTMRQSFFDEELLNEFYIQLEQLEDTDNPNFVENVIDLFFRDSTKILYTMEENMNKTPPDYIDLDSEYYINLVKDLHQLKGSSASIGANKITIAVNQTWEFLNEGNLEGAKSSLQQLKMEHSTLKAKFKTYFKLLKQVGPAGPGTAYP